MLTNHHILMDGWSMPVLVQELLTLYASSSKDGSFKGSSFMPSLWARRRCCRG